MPLIRIVPALILTSLKECSKSFGKEIFFSEFHENRMYGLAVNTG
jgi:hypothetical protein